MAGTYKSTETSTVEATVLASSTSASQDPRLPQNEKKSLGWKYRKAIWINFGGSQATLCCLRLIGPGLNAFACASIFHLILTRRLFGGCLFTISLSLILLYYLFAAFLFVDILAMPFACLVLGTIIRAPALLSQYIGVRIIRLNTRPTAALSSFLLYFFNFSSSSSSLPHVCLFSLFSTQIMAA